VSEVFDNREVDLLTEFGHITAPEEIVCEFCGEPGMSLCDTCGEMLE